MDIWGTNNSKFNKKTVRSLLLIDCKVTDCILSAAKHEKELFIIIILSEVSRRRKNEKRRG